MEDSEKKLEVAEPTDGVVEETTSVAEETTETNSEPLEFTDSNNQEQTEEETKTVTEKVEESKEKDVTVQSKEENSKYAQARRKAELEFKKKEEAAYKRGKFEAFKGKVNPYTSTEITDENDFEVYEEMCEIAKKGRDPVADFIQYTTDKRREEKKALEEKEKINEEAKKDIEEFTEKYPDLNLSELLNDEDFKDYIDGKRKPLVQLYENYKKLENKFRNNGIEIAKKTIANNDATPGSLNGGGEQTIDYANMSDAEFERILNGVKNGEIR